MPTRGYQSSVSPVLHFGLGSDKFVDSLRIIWQRGKSELLQKIKGDQQITLNEKNATFQNVRPAKVKSLFTETNSPVDYQSKPNTTNDFQASAPAGKSAFLLRAMRDQRRCVNGDGLEDVYVGSNT